MSQWSVRVPIVLSTLKLQTSRMDRMVTKATTRQGVLVQLSDTGRCKWLIGRSGTRERFCFCPILYRNGRPRIDGRPHQTDVRSAAEAISRAWQKDHRPVSNREFRYSSANGR